MDASTGSKRSTYSKAEKQWGGFNDSHWFRHLGIASYGVDPFLIPEAEGAGLHGDNERISIENKKGTAVMLDIVRTVVRDKKK